MISTGFALLAISLAWKLLPPTKELEMVTIIKAGNIRLKNPWDFEENCFIFQRQKQNGKIKM
jgi:hypothetical protein